MINIHREQRAESREPCTNIICIFPFMYGFPGTLDVPLYKRYHGNENLVLNACRLIVLYLEI